MIVVLRSCIYTLYLLTYVENDIKRYVIKASNHYSEDVNPSHPSILFVLSFLLDRLRADVWGCN